MYTGVMLNCTAFSHRDRELGLATRHERLIFGASCMLYIIRFVVFIAAVREEIDCAELRAHLSTGLMKAIDFMTFTRQQSASPSAPQAVLVSTIEAYGQSSAL